MQKDISSLQMQLGKVLEFIREMPLPNIQGQGNVNAAGGGGANGNALIGARVGGQAAAG